MLLVVCLAVGCNDTNSSTEEPIIEEKTVSSSVNLVKPTLTQRVDASLAILTATRQYDRYFKRYTAQYLPHIDWRFLKSLCWVESSFRPEVLSPVGAIGLCQFMPATFEQYKRTLNMPYARPTNPEHSIQFAAAHMQYLVNFWKSPRPEEDRLKLGGASYNAGQGNLLRAQRVCRERNGKAILYNEIIICLIDITGPDNSRETTNHVYKIWKNWYALLIAG